MEPVQEARLLKSKSTIQNIALTNQSQDFGSSQNRNNFVRGEFKNPRYGNFPLREEGVTPLSVNGPSVKGEGVPPFSVKKVLLPFWENLVRGGPGGGVPPLRDGFRD